MGEFSGELSLTPEDERRNAERMAVMEYLRSRGSDTLEPMPEDELSPAQLEARAAEQASPLPVARSAQPEPLPGMELSTPSGYLAALDKARQLDAIQAAAAAASQGIAQVGQIASRGLFKPQAAPPILSAAADIEQRRAAVMDFVRQERERQRAAADLGLSPLRRDLMLQQTAAAKALAEQRAREPEPRPSLVAKEQAEAEKKRKEAELLGKPKPSQPQKPSKPRDFVAEKTAEYERRLKEGIPSGYELVPGRQPTIKQREDAAKIVISRGMVDETLKDVRNLLSTPNAVASPSTRLLLSQQGEFLKGQLRVLEDLGVPSGPDAQILGRLIGDPESIVGDVLNVTTQKLDALGKYVGNRADLTTNTYGLQRKQTVPTPAASTVKVRRKSDGAVVDVPAADVERFVAAGKVERLP